MSYYSNITTSLEDLEQYRQCVADLDLPIETMDELIAIVHVVLSHFVDQAFNVQTDQITLQSISRCFNVSPDHATIEHHHEHRTADVRGQDVEGDSNPLGPTEP